MTFFRGDDINRDLRPPLNRALMAVPGDLLELCEPNEDVIVVWRRIRVYPQGHVNVYLHIRPASAH